MCFAFIGATKSGKRAGVAERSFNRVSHRPAALAPEIEKVTNVTRRCFDRSSDSIAIFKSVFLEISTIPTSSARCRKLINPNR
jgi:hypothetical protein